MKRHLIGIGGVGMSALAIALKRLGDEVSGADRSLDSPNVAFLRERGIAVFPDDGTGVKADTDEVIVSTAIEADNPGLKRAQAHGIVVTHRAAALSRALSAYKLVAVAGTCGKSTVTALLGHVLAECGLDPMVVNGAGVVGWEGAVRFGRGEYAVAEVDESDKSLVAFTPYAAVITNASADHYSEAEMNKVFDDFIRNVPGPVIDGRHLLLSPVEVSLIGEHNRQNAALALAMAVALGCDEGRARSALLTFRGVERRLTSHGQRVFDDYAHNPEKLTAMWRAVRAAQPGPLCVVWRPHGYGPLKKMLNSLAAAFGNLLEEGDALLILPVYDAGGTADRSIDSSALVRLLASAAGEVMTVESYAAVKTFLASRVDRFSAAITCGARDVELPRLADALAQIFEGRI